MDESAIRTLLGACGAQAYQPIDRVSWSEEAPVVACAPESLFVVRQRFCGAAGRGVGVNIDSGDQLCRPGRTARHC